MISMNGFVAGLLGGAIAVAMAKLLMVIGAKLKLLPEWVEGRTGWHFSPEFHAAWDAAIDVGVQAANAFRTKAFWTLVVKLLRQNKSEDAIQMLLEAAKDAIKAGVSSLKLPEDLMIFWNEVRKDFGRTVAKADLEPHVQLTPSMKMPSDETMDKALEAAVVVDKVTNAPAPLSDAEASDLKSHLEQLIAESKARQAKLTAKPGQ
jgi:hypothetical protein